MPLPTWYRFLRSAPAAIAGLFMLGFGLYLAVTPTSYSDPNNPKMVDYANHIHPVVVILGIVFACVGGGLLWLAYVVFSQMPSYLREYSYEDLRLGQALARRIISLTKDDEWHHKSVKYTDGSEVGVGAYFYYERNKSFWNRLKEFLSYGLGETVSFRRSQPSTEVDGVLHIPELSFRIDSFTGKASRDESVHRYRLDEEPPLVDEDSPLAHAVRDFGLEEEFDLEELTRPRVRKSFMEREKIEDPGAYYRFMRRMGLDRPSSEELQVALDELKEW